MVVFQKTIHYLKQHCVNTLKNKRDISYEPKDIRWVLTVPAVWTNKAKQFMRKAAIMVSIV